MRILVLDENNGKAHVRERREIFDVSEFRLSYVCPGCNNEFIFRPDKEGEPKQAWRVCPVCNADLKTKRDEGSAPPPVLLWEAISRYREFYSFVTKHDISLKLMAVQGEPNPTVSL